jgi:hypothetical protein
MNPRLSSTGRPPVFSAEDSGFSVCSLCGEAAGTGGAVARIHYLHGIDMNSGNCNFEGLLVVTAAVAAGLVFRFGELRWLGKELHAGVYFDRAPGVERGPGANGILIAAVRGSRSTKVGR